MVISVLLELLGLCVCVCWICSLDGALPLGQEALISCGGGGEDWEWGALFRPSLMLLFGTTEGQSFCLRLLPPPQRRQEEEHWPEGPGPGEG